MWWRKIFSACMSWINPRPSPILCLYRWFKQLVWKSTLSLCRRFDSVLRDQIHWWPWGYYNQPKQGLGEDKNLGRQVESDIWTIKVQGYDNIQEKDSNQASTSVMNELEILGVTTDSKLTWTKHVSNTAWRPGKKLGALRSSIQEVEQLSTRPTCGV